MAQAAPLVPSAQDFDQPPLLHNAEGRLRTVGVEMEFSGPSAFETAQALAHHLGGEVVEEDPHFFRVRRTSIGDLAIELDSRMMHPEKKDTLLGGVVPRIAAWIGSAASVLIPCELVTGPIPLDRLHEVDGVIAILRDIGARGTQDAAFFAFGLHFNPETPAKDVDTIAAFLKAFVLLDAWLRRQAAPDPTREMLGFETLTFAPIDRNLIDTGLISKEERRWIDDYHSKVVEIVGPQVEGDVLDWLRESCRPL